MHLSLEGRNAQFMYFVKVQPESTDHDLIPILLCNIVPSALNSAIISCGTSIFLEIYDANDGKIQRNCPFLKGVQHISREAAFNHIKARRIRVVRTEGGKASHWFKQLYFATCVNTSSLHKSTGVACVHYLDEAPPVDKVDRILNALS